jgi:hypothetical protein
MTDNELIESICRNYGLEEKIVMQYREIPEREAIQRFLSPEAKRAIQEKEKLVQERDFSHLTPINAKITKRLLIANAFRAEEYREEFCKTPEGKLWYECNVISGPVYNEICARAYTDAQKFARAIAQGQARTLMTLGTRPRRFKL